MGRRWRAAAWLIALLPGLAFARGDFDYWMLSLSWSPEYCDSEHRSGEPQCEREYHFVVHGLWPQHEVGYPRSCGKVEPVPPDLVERMLPLMPSERLIQHEWRKHGSCSGLDVSEYFLQTERARRRIVIPTQYQSVERPLRTRVSEVEREFMESNPGLSPDGIALYCSGRWLREVRVCLDKSFEFRACGLDVKDRCREEISVRPSRPGRR